MAQNQNQTQKQFYKMFIENLQDIYSAEDQYIQAFPRILENVSTDELRTKLKDHFEVTKKQKERLLRVFRELKESPSGVNCEGMKGLLNECERIGDENFSGIVKDATLIGALQKCEHYQIAAYGALRAFAKHLELSNVENILQEMLKEEWKADKNLTTLAEGGWFTTGINAEAVR